METRFASYSGCIRNTATVVTQPLPPQAQSSDPPPQTTEETPSSGLGGQIGELAAALNVIGWNHNQVPPEERLPPQERL